MPPRRSQRKRAATNEGAEEPGPLAKLPKLSPDVVWEWEGDGGRWNQYTPEHAQSLTSALQRGDKETTLQVTPSVKMNVRFSNMTQMNVTTGWQRSVRCLHKGAVSRGMWEFQELTSHKWTAYPSDTTQRYLEACYVCGVEQARVEAVRGKELTVDLKTMKLSNERSKEEGRVRRVDPALWQWQDEHGHWQDYDPDISLQLESTEAATLTISSSGRPYSIDKKKMEQTNTITLVSRKIRRLGPLEALGTGGGTASETGMTGSEPSSSGASVSETGESGTDGGSRAVTTESSTDGGSRAVTTESSTDGVVTRVAHGKVPVDYVCTQKVGKAHVYCEGGEYWDATLNQTNLRNNNNKFYILQLLEDNSSRKYSVWFRWGRVGKTGQHLLLECGTDLEQAKLHFTKKFHDKTLNDWEDRQTFVKHSGKYDLLSMDYEPKDEPDVGSPSLEKKSFPESKLDSRLQSLIELICNVQAMEEMVMEMKYDTKKAPLGKLTVDQIHSGYIALKKIEGCINRGNRGDQLVQACDEFYTRIPHNFGMRRPPLIVTKEDVREKLALLEALGDIEIAMKVLSHTEREEHPTDTHYHSLHCRLAPLSHEDDMFKLVEKYVRQTHAKTHTQYRLEVVDVFDMEKRGERAQFRDLGNRQLLWHGSRLTNWVGILSQGLRIAPPEAPVTGYMFGKGVYFADVCSKSANYCFASKAKNEGVILLGEVSLGQTNDLLAADYSADKLPEGKHSTRGLGRMAPDPAQSETLSDGCVVPLGTIVDTGVHNPLGYTLNYNEFVVYDTRQIKMRYLVRLKFHFK